MVGIKKIRVAALALATLAGLGFHAAAQAIDYGKPGEPIHLTVTPCATFFCNPLIYLEVTFSSFSHSKNLPL